MFCCKLPPLESAGSPAIYIDAFDKHGRAVRIGVANLSTETAIKIGFEAPASLIINRSDLLARKEETTGERLWSDVQGSTRYA